MTALKKKKGYKGLIRFDQKTWIFIGLCLLFYFLFVALKWHSSSIGNWNQIVNDGGGLDRGIITGKPLQVRSDEWLVYSSFVLSQLHNQMPVENEAVGYGKSPLALSLPTHHILSYVRPAFWGYYLMGSEHAFSWQWNFKIFPFLITAFLLLMLFTGNQFWLSIFGCVWLFLSSPIQWWSMNTEIFTYSILALISFIYIFFAQKRIHILAGGIGLFIFGYAYAILLYPAYQVPMAYFLLALLTGYVVLHWKTCKTRWTQHRWLRVGACAGSLGLLGILMVLFYQECKETIEVMTNTYYPGKRNETGGQFQFVRLFTDNVGHFMEHGRYPAKWNNMSEISSFLMLFPVASVLLLIDFFRKKKWNPVLTALFLFQLVVFIWFFIGFPNFLSKLTLFSTSPTYRTFYIFGFANVVSTLLYLGLNKQPVLTTKWTNKVFSALVIIPVAFLIHYFLNKNVDQFFTSTQVLIATGIYSVLVWLLVHYHDHHLFRKGFFLAVLLFILPNMTVNPLARGLDPFYENIAYQEIAKIHREDPAGKWLVLGKIQLPNFVKATGANCFNGVQFVPPLDQLHVLDPHMAFDTVYNRYAHIIFSPWVNSRDSVFFQLHQADFYGVYMDPCSFKLSQLGVKYYLFDKRPNPEEVRCMTLIRDMGVLFIYRRDAI
jgi:hypothetical protein